ncbi:MULTISPECIES: hypothetical protein [unclassified Lentimonas]|uniref:ORC-CDC6 family AAA ATPase n=1 Tax=unclassified Lentimonas TaxID=2630993 RepID=UPI001327913E|nr:MULTISPECIES: hypothetical protein [unclassified Lentimonas]CAA6692637.1 Unannotated [Lentimonas sp. CC19]CAA6696980.1 Unannotated [Lentimonas sp. CC10]CAA7071004.1 Unannotated [Lentimonas sp. CC11]
MKNPFSVKTPETLSAADIAASFIDVFSDFQKILDPSHTFIHGPRGTGKSMMLRYLEPEVQIAAKKVRRARELDFFAVHIPIKSSYYSIGDLGMLDGAAAGLLSEHFLVINIATEIISSLDAFTDFTEQERQSFLQQCGQLMEEVGFEGSEEAAPSNFNKLSQILKLEYKLTKKYISTLTFTKTLIPYEATLLTYGEFLEPLIHLIRQLEVTPTGPIFLMLDDADNLPVTMQQVVNGWVSYRSTENICLKISTQQRYRTWRTPSGMLIESSHDFSEIDISSVYTSKQSSHYYDNVEKVILRRLSLAGINDVTPSQFFPSNEEQDRCLTRIKAQIGNEWDQGRGISARRSDDILRYSTSEYMKGLAAKKKQNHFSYAGFRSLVDISSGTIRGFLEPAALMYSELQAKDPNPRINQIPAETQDRVLSKWSQSLILEGFERLKNDINTTENGESDDVEKLRSLINGIGELFQAKLVSNDSERRLIAFMVTQSLSKSTQNVLDLAVEWGYFHVKTIGRKEGVGRNRAYILNRRLAPYFKLDPSGYAAYISITPKDLELAMTNHRMFTQKRLSNTEESKPSEFSQPEIPLL